MSYSCRHLACAALAVAVLLPARARASEETAGPWVAQHEPPRHPPRTPERQAEPRRRPEAERPSPPTPPARHPQRPIVVRGEVFVGGFFYDPIFGPYPWWDPWRYPYPYAPIYDVRALLRVKATPKDATVYVDGFYAGEVDDFDGVFQALPLSPGGHAVTLYRPGWRSQRFPIYLHAGATFTIRASLEPLPPGQAADLPPKAAQVPPPPRPGSYRVPVQRWPRPAPDDTEPVADAASSSLEVRVQPVGATVSIDGERWFTSTPGHVVAALPAGSHRLRVSAPGFAPANIEVTLGYGERRAISVSLEPES